MFNSCSSLVWQARWGLTPQRCFKVVGFYITCYYELKYEKDEWVSISNGAYSMINTVYHWRLPASMPPVLGNSEADKEHLMTARPCYGTFPLQQHRMQTPILLLWLDRLKYDSFHRQQLSVSLCVIIRRYERQSWRLRHRAGFVL